jgi:glucose-6-phosphate isomerase
MPVTAARLGSSPLLVDWSNFVIVPANSGRLVQPDFEEITQGWQKLLTLFLNREVGFFDSPIDDSLSQAQATQALASRLLDDRRKTDCLVLGIGGSALGPICAIQALEHLRRGGLQMHFLENPDPTDWNLTLSRLHPDRTWVVVITKSGGTFETLAQAMLAMEWLGEARCKNQLVAITDPQKGELRALSKAQGWQTLEIAPSIGGRFSVFSPVGLLPLALAGLSIEKFLKGARLVREAIEKTPIEKNPLFLLASLLKQHAPKRSVHVCMPYSTRLRSVGLWWVQLWGESLGKQGKGFTPLAAVGATDQHSILQLLRDGPDDKVTWFISVDESEDPVKIPRAPLIPQVDLPTFQLLQSHSLAELLTIEYRATSLVLTKNQRPNLTFQLDRLNEESIGALLYALCVLTAMQGAVLEVNPFDQPGVEEGKVYIRDALSRSSAGAWQEEQAGDS